MPITLTVPEGLLSTEAEAEVFAELTDALLDIAGLACPKLTSSPAANAPPPHSSN
jgi:hypothetical protein